MTYNNSKIMKTAWKIYRKGMKGETSRDSFALALKEAWAMAKRPATDLSAVRLHRRGRISKIIRDKNSKKAGTLILTREMMVAA